MSERAADDFSAIASAMKRLRGEYEPKVCSECEGGGWTAYGLGQGDPHFRECESCYNPEGHPCP